MTEETPTPLLGFVVKESSLLSLARALCFPSLISLTLDRATDHLPQRHRSRTLQQPQPEPARPIRCAGDGPLHARARPPTRAHFVLFLFNNLFSAEWRKGGECRMERGGEGGTEKNKGNYGRTDGRTDGAAANCSISGANILRVLGHTSRLNENDGVAARPSWGRD